MREVRRSLEKIGNKSREKEVKVWFPKFRYDTETSASYDCEGPTPNLFPLCFLENCQTLVDKMNLGQNEWQGSKH